MTNERPERVELLQGTLDLIVLRALATMGPQHAYSLAARLEQVADHPLPHNQGTLYAALAPPGVVRRQTAPRRALTMSAIRRFLLRFYRLIRPAPAERQLTREIES